MIDRRQFVGAVATLLVSPAAAHGQPAGRVWRIGFIEAGSASVNRHFADAFRQGLRDLGYVEGGNVAIEERWADGRPERFPGLLGELIALKVDIIVQASTAGALAAKNSKATVPIVFVGVNDPVGAGLAKSLAHPGGNLTGLSLAWGEGLAGKWPELLKEVLPGVSRAGLLFNSRSPSMAPWVRETQAAATALGVRLQPFEVQDANGIEAAFAAMIRDRLGALIVITDPLTLRHRQRLVRLAASNRLVAVYSFGEFARAGGLVAYGPNVADMFRRAAAYVDRLLRGARPADLPIEQPTKFELVINLKTARALGLTIPPSLLARADQILE